MGTPRRHLPEDCLARQARRRGLVFTLIAVALLLAISFFYLTNQQRDDRVADDVTQAASSADNAVISISDAAKNAADAMRKDKKAP